MALSVCIHGVPRPQYCPECEADGRHQIEDLQKSCAEMRGHIDLALGLGIRLNAIDAKFDGIFQRLQKLEACVCRGFQSVATEARKCPWCGIVLVRKGYGLSELSGRIHVCPGDPR
jgi:hypothetical protein